jgi:hypothetical protein
VKGLRGEGAQAVGPSQTGRKKFQNRDTAGTTPVGAGVRGPRSGAKSRGGVSRCGLGGGGDSDDVDDCCRLDGPDVVAGDQSDCSLIGVGCSRSATCTRQRRRQLTASSLPDSRAMTDPRPYLGLGLGAPWVCGSVGLWERLDPTRREMDVFPVT